MANVEAANSEEGGSFRSDTPSEKAFSYAPSLEHS